MVENTATAAEVLVVGGGPTGLCAALALGRLGVLTVVLERRQTTSTHPRGHVENGRTMELFRLWGIEREVREQGLPREFLASVAFMTRFAGISLGEIRFHEDAEWVMGHDGKGPAALSSTPQDRLEPILLREVREQPSVSVRFATEVVSLESRPGGVVATVRGLGAGLWLRTRRRRAHPAGRPRRVAQRRRCGGRPRPAVHRALYSSASMSPRRSRAGHRTDRYIDEALHALRPALAEECMLCVRMPRGTPR